MKKKTLKAALGFIVLAAASAFALASCSGGSTTGEPATAENTAQAAVSDMDVLLTRFDSLDFDVYSHQKWDLLSVSHDDNILVHYPDGSTTTGLHDHIEQLKPMFVFAPDTKVSEHPVKFAVNGWTSVIGTLEGTFTEPMPIGGGKTIPPTGKKFKLSMSTVAHWKNGKMIEEYLFWDNQAFLKQIGLAQ
ncbi:MAG: ester cyclase [Taibaiella sp.]|nr:ester cyclase [Taibaiella sp.]